jgi:Flp pilus assembly protein CpaB
MRKEAAFERREAVRVLASARKSELEASSLQAREHVLAWRANALQLALRATIDAQMMREEAALVLSNSVDLQIGRQAARMQMPGRGTSSSTQHGLAMDRGYSQYFSLLAMFVASN